MDTLIHFGGSVKALGDGRVAGYLITFSDETSPDLTGDFFTKDTDLDLEDGKKTAIYYAHGLDKKLGPRRIGVGTLKSDDVGVWVEAQLNLRDDYEKAIYNDLAAKGKLGWSSGTANHLVTRDAVKVDGRTVHAIKTWPLGLDSSLTPTPAEPRNDAIALKSLSALIGMDDECGCDDDSMKTLPDGWSYRDLMNFLESEANEDFGIQGSTDVYGMYTPSVMVWGFNLLENPDRFVYRRTDKPGDLFARPYTVENNDAVWGDEQEVIETTTYVNASDDDAVPMMAGKQADVAALKGMLRGSMTLDDHADVVRDAMSGFVTRAESLSTLAVKAGKPMSAARHAKLSQAYAGMRTAHTAMETHLQAINDMLLSTNPDAKKDAEEFAALRTQSVRLQSTQLRMTG